MDGPAETVNLPVLHLFVLNGLDEGHPHWERAPCFTQSMIQMLISSRNILIDTPRNVLPALWSSLRIVILRDDQPRGHIKSTITVTLCQFHNLPHLISSPVKRGS